MDTFDLACALRELVPFEPEQTKTRVLLDLHSENVERYFREHRNKQEQTAIGDALGDHADKLDIIVYKKKAAKIDAKRCIVVDPSLRGNAERYSRRSNSVG